jgi:hypothetical protein
MESEHREVLRLVQEGKVSAEEAARLLEAMGDEEEAAESAPAEVVISPHERQTLAEEIAPSTRRPYWAYILLFGLGWTLVGASLTLRANGTWWLVLAIPFLLVGLAILTFGIASRGATWLSVRISDSGGRSKIALDFPVPLTLAAWGVGIARPFVPQLRDTAVDELILSLRDGGAKGEVLLVDVVDDEDGERVQVRFG